MLSSILVSYKNLSQVARVFTHQTCKRVYLRHARVSGSLICLLCSHKKKSEYFSPVRQLVQTGWCYLMPMLLLRTRLVGSNSRDAVNRSPPRSSVCGMFQARIWEWVAISSSRGFSQPREWTFSLTFPVLTGSLPLAPLGKPHNATFSLLIYSFKHQDTRANSLVSSQPQLHY